ncbi:PREDICTED: integumentary mucin C.1-like [Poecilia mexicana]|nr:PREDICTED: integumentary mucin C.1-like [Poecilia mexicana]
MQSVGSITSGPTCCTTSLCNVPSATTTTTAPTTTTTTPAPTTTTRTTAAATTSTISPTITSTIRAYSSGATQQQIYKGCAASSLCLRTGSQTFSVNLGFQSGVASAECCNTNNCNSQTLTLPGSEYLNGLKCVACDPSPSQCNTPTAYSGDGGNCLPITAQ